MFSSFSFFSTTTISHCFHSNRITMVRRQAKVRPPNRVFVPPNTHPSECRSFSYSQEMRLLAVTNRLNGIDGPENEQIQHLRNLGQYPSEWTVNRWVQRYIEHGHIRPFRRTGNIRSVREIKGRRLILLALHRAALPKSTLAEVNAFIFNMSQHDPNNDLHSNSQICRAEKSIFVTKMRASTTAFQAMTPINIQRRFNFWNLPYPFGSVGINPRDMIDLDEAGIYPNNTNRSYGKGTVGGRVREVGLYVRKKIKYFVSNIRR